MPYQIHNRITLSGVFGLITAPVEEWSWSFATSPSASGEPGAFKALSAEVLVAYNTHIRPLMGPRVVLTRIRSAAINEAGKVPQTTQGAYLQGDNETNQPGTATQATLYPLQTALVVSLMTPRAGATGKGRFFLPWPARIVDSTYTLGSVDTTAVANACASFLSNVAGSQSFVGGIEVASTKGYSSPVTSIRVGSVPDTMRSRRGRVPEVYATGIVTG